MKKLFTVIMLLFVALAVVACNTTTTSTTTTSSQTTSTTSATTTTSQSTTTSTSSSTPTTTTTGPTTTTTSTTTTPITTTEDPVITLRDNRRIIFGDVNTGIDLSMYRFKGDFGEMLLSEVTFGTLPEGIVITDGSMTIANKGIYHLSFTAGTANAEITLITKLASEEEYVVFEDSFDTLPNGPLPSGYTLHVGTAGIVSGKLQLDGRTSNPTRVLLPGYLQGLKNYIIETDFSILSANEPTRWASVMYRFGSSGYFQMAIRQNATLTNGVEFAKWINNGWNVPKTIAYSEAINSASIYRLKIDLLGDTVNEYINNQLLITYENASDFSSGYIGMQANGSVAVYNNIKITVPADYIDNSSLELTTFPTLYKPETGIVLPPSAMVAINSYQDLVDMSQAVRPQIALMNIDHTLQIVSDSGVRIVTLLDALKLLDGKVIPAFYIRNRDVAVNVAGQLKGYGIRDVFLISHSATTISDARAVHSMLRGILEIPYNPAKPTLSNADLLNLRNSTNIAGAIGALLPPQYTTKANVEYLQHRLVSVFSNAKEGLPHAYQAVLAGVQGLITNDVEGLYEFYQLFPENSLIREPMIIGHRGMPSKAPENTLEGSMLAYEAGADVIELDIYLSTDGRIIVMHDTTTARTANGNMTVESSTYAQLQTLTLLDSTGKYPGLKIPTLDDYFEMFKGLDVQIFIEIKSTKPEIVPALAALIEEYDFHDQATVITFHASQAENMRLHLPHISVGYLNTSLASKTNLLGSLTSILNSVVPLKTTYNPEMSPLTEELLVELSFRGITTWPWTMRSAADLYRMYAHGIGGATTDNTYVMSYDWIQMQLNQSTFDFTLANSPADIPLRGVIRTLNGLEYEYIPTYIVIDDGGTGIQVSGNAIVSNFSQAGTAYILVSFEATFLNGTTYRIYDDLVVINIRP